MEALRVIIVEDDFIVATAVETALSDAGHTVCGIAATQLEAIDLGRAEKPDCAVVDIRLAPGDGRVVARALAGQHIAVLFATGQCEDIASFGHTGALGCLPKPYQPDDIPAALEAICHHQRGEPPTALPDSMFLLDE